MSSQANFKTDVENSALQYSRFTVSRVFDTTQDDLLEVEYPAGLDVSNLYVQLSFYSIADDSLIYATTVVRPPDVPSAFFTRTLQYEDDSVRTMFFVDFSKVELEDELPVGQFRVVLNFFVPEVGNFNQNPLRIVDISPSRTEIQLALLSDFQTPQMVQLLSSFSRPSINSKWVTQSVNVIFNKSTGGDMPTVTSSFSVEEVGEEFPMGLLDETRDDVFKVINGLLSSSYGFVTQSVNSLREQGKARFTDDELYTLISASLSTQYSAFLRRNDLGQMLTKFTLPEIDLGGTE